MTRHTEHTRAQRQELRGWSPRKLGSLVPSSCAYPSAVIVDFARAEGPT
jgi:hypothetical protein